MDINSAIGEIVRHYQGNGLLTIISLTLDLRQNSTQNAPHLRKIYRTLVRKGIDPKIADIFCFPK